MRNMLLRALDREPLPRPPVWLMRQAGRYLPEYRALRAEAGSFLALARDPELACEITLQPIRRFGMDAAVVFSDILLPLEAMGMELEFDERGPVLKDPIRTLEDAGRLGVPDPGQSLAYVGETLRRVRAGLPDDTALIGFAGAPFTLASYAIEGGTSRSFLELRRVLHHQPEAFERLMDSLAETVAAHLRFQVESGAEAVMLFDTWAGILGREDYRRYAAPWTRRVLEATANIAPRILFAGASDHLLEELAELGAEAISIDHRTDIARAFGRTGGQHALQGNLDPALLLSTPVEVRRRTRALLDEVGGRAGHVLNLGHGVLKTTDPDCVAAFVETAREAR